jgi:hypothetical protein
MIFIIHVFGSRELRLVPASSSRSQSELSLPELLLLSAVTDVTVEECMACWFMGQ